MDAAAQQAMLSPSTNQAAFTLRQQISLMASLHNAAAALSSASSATSTFPLLAAATNHSMPTHPALMSLTSVQSSVLEPYVTAQPQGNVYSSPATLYESAAAASILAAAAVTSQAATATTGGHHSYLLSCPFNMPAPPNAAPQPCVQHRYGASPAGLQPSATLLTSSMSSATLRQHHALQQASSSTAQQMPPPSGPNGMPSISANASLSVQYRGPTRIMKRPAGYGTSGPSSGSTTGGYSSNSSSSYSATDDPAATSSRAPKLRRITSYEDTTPSTASIQEQPPAQLAHNAALLESRQVVSSMAELVAAVSEAAANAAASSMASSQVPAAAQQLNASPYIPQCPVCVACQQHLPTATQHCGCHHHHHHCHHSVCSICSAAGSAAAAQAGYSSERPVPSPAGSSSLAALGQSSVGAASTVANATALVNTLQQIQQQAQQQASSVPRPDVHPLHSALLASRYAQQEREQHANNMWYQRQQQSLQSILRLQPQPVIMFPARQLHHHHHPSMMELLVLHPPDTLVFNGTHHPNPAAAHAAQHGAPEPQPIGATPDQIKRHTNVLHYVKDPNVPEQERERCTVCLTDFETGDELRTLSCSHLFHVDCIDRWLQYNKKCPVCRVDMDKLSAPLVVDAASIST
ncbi:ring finger-H2 protein [Aphelenchoides avenae]|nr:ring finger-H2 protein [Aphelenchus avenae]